MDPSFARPSQQFVATSQGLSATRWFSFVLASHPEVFVAHGHHALDSILRGNFEQEKQASKTDSLTFGTQLNSFYAHKSLTDVFRTYQAVMPTAKVYGSVHAYTLERLVSKAAEGDWDFNTLRVINIIRHPVHYIASHQALVGLAREHQLPIYEDHYEGVMFEQAIAQFPELTLFANLGSPEFISFVVSCLSVCNQAEDFVYTPFKHIQMEQLTTDVPCLKGVCDYLTGLDYPLETLESFMHRGAINLHQKRAERDPKAVYEGWEVWQQDIAHMMLPTELLDRFEAEGYDVTMLRLEADPAPRIARVNSQALSFEVPHDNVWRLQYQLREAQAALEKARQEGFELRVQLQRVEASLPQYSYPSPTLIEVFGEYNIVAWKDLFYGLSQVLGPVDLTAQSFSEQPELIVGLSPEAVKRTIETTETTRLPLPYPSPTLIEAVGEYNIVAWEGHWYGIPRALGPMDLASVSPSEQAEIIVGLSLDAVKYSIQTYVLKLEEIRQQQAQIEQLRRELERSHLKVEKTQLKLEQEKSKVKTLKQQLNQMREGLQHAHQTIQSMESSKFWKIRNAWQQVRQRIGLHQNS